MLFRKSGVYPPRREQIIDDQTTSSFIYSSSSETVTWKVVESNHEARPAHVPKERERPHFKVTTQCLVTHAPPLWCKKVHKVCPQTQIPPQVWQKVRVCYKAIKEGLVWQPPPLCLT